jgi:protein Mpv17
MRLLLGWVLVSATPFASGLHLGPLSSAMQAYSHSLALRPLETKVVTAAVLAVGGDALAQLRECEPYDARRAASFVLFNTCYRGAFQHNAFPLITKIFQGNSLHGLLPVIPLEVCAAISRTAANQLVVVPVVYYPLFFAMTGAVQGLTLSASVQRAREKFLPLLKRSLAFWIPVQYIQFAYVAAEWQVPYICVWGLLWNVIVSVVAGHVGYRVPVEDDESSSAAPASPVARLRQCVQGVVRPTVQAMRRRQKVDSADDDVLAEDRLLLERANGDAR